MEKEIPSRWTYIPNEYRSLKDYKTNCNVAALLNHVSKFGKGNSNQDGRIYLMNKEVLKTTKLIVI